MAKTQNVAELLTSRIERDKFILVTKIMERAQKGEPNAMKLIENFLTNSLTEKAEEEFPLTDAQFNRIILTRAKRIEGRLAD